MNPRRRRIKRRRRRERREHALYLEALAAAYDCLFDHDQDDGPEDDDEYGLFFITFGEPFA